MNTHTVFNQAPPFEDVNLYESDAFLKSIANSKAGQEWENKLSEYGELMGSSIWAKLGFDANKYSPIFHSHDKFGKRIDWIEFHPSYHEIMQAGINNQLHSLPWSSNKSGAHLARLALNYLHAQNESGTNCPITMTFSSVPALQHHFQLADEWLPKITTPHYNPENKPYFEKQGLTIGMAMTEKQGGTDVRANTTTATADGNHNNCQTFRLTGHKWFCSAPMSDAFLTLAQTANGLSCFLMPRWQPDGTKNTWHIQRLKDKLGNRSNASSEIEMHNAFAWLVGEEGRGVPTIIEMVSMTRYDCMIGSSGLMRRGLAEAMHHCKHRKVMGKLLTDQPLMQSVLNDLVIESEAALALSAQAAIWLQTNSEQSRELLRLLLPIGKYWITKRASPMLVECMECLGGNGYVEQSILPRLYREAPVNAIWEGSGNVQCLDVLRVANKTPQSISTFIDWLYQSKSFHSNYAYQLDNLNKNIKQWLPQQQMARMLVEKLALLAQVSALILLGNYKTAEQFCNQRLGNNSIYQFGAGC